MTTTINGSAVTIPAAEHLTGFVTVAIDFPTTPAAHRITRLYHRPDGTDGGIPVKFDGSTPFTDEIRPLCQPDSNPAERYYELSIPFALARGAVACDRSECFGGAA